LDITASKPPSELCPSQTGIHQVDLMQHALARAELSTAHSVCRTYTALQHQQHQQHTHSLFRFSGMGYTQVAKILLSGRNTSLLTHSLTHFETPSITTRARPNNASLAATSSEAHSLYAATKSGKHAHAAVNASTHPKHLTKQTTCSNSSTCWRRRYSQSAGWWKPGGLHFPNLPIKQCTPLPRLWPPLNCTVTACILATGSPQATPPTVHTRYDSRRPQHLSYLSGRSPVSCQSSCWLRRYRPC
jgi:hypothetical protein